MEFTLIDIWSCCLATLLIIGLLLVIIFDDLSSRDYLSKCSEEERKIINDYRNRKIFKKKYHR